MDVFRSEAAMFRVVIKIGLGAALVIAVALLSEPIYGALVAIGLIAFWVGWVWSGRGSEDSDEEPPPGRDPTA